MDIENTIQKISSEANSYFRSPDFFFDFDNDINNFKQLRILQEYEHVKDIPQPKPKQKLSSNKNEENNDNNDNKNEVKNKNNNTLESSLKKLKVESNKVPLSQALTILPSQKKKEETNSSPASKSLRLFKDLSKPQAHAPWKLMRVISGHLGWVRAIDVDVSNEWFVTGAGDRMIKIWDLASGKLKASLTGHISTIRGIVISPRHPYFFSCSEDKSIRCWDLETRQEIRKYFGHLSGVYALSLHPTLDVLVSGGRDSTCRVWDMRTRAQVHCLSGHTNTVSSVLTQKTHPQIVTGSQDCQVRLWDLAAGKCDAILTHHKKSVRALVSHPTLNMFASGAPDNIKQWKNPDGNFLQNLSGHNTILHSLALNHDDVLVSGGDNGSMFFWDWKSGKCFQKLQTQVQPGSLESEAGIFALKFDQTGSRLITGEADKTIKIYKEDENWDGN